MAEPTLSRQLSEFAVEARYKTLDAAVIDSVRLRVLDTLGLTIRARSLQTSQAMIGYVRDQGGTPEATAVGIDHLVPAALACLVNGTLAHSLDYDDTHLPSVLHPSAVVVPAALAVAEKNHASGEELIAAIAVGLEVCVRLGMAGYDQSAGNSTFFEHGQHATSICGAMGATVSAALLNGLDADGIQSSLGITASMASGIIEANRTGGTVKRAHCGWAAHSGVTAAELTRHGFTGPPTVLEGRFGFFQAFLKGVYDPAAITAGLGTSWAVPGIFFKPYPANHFLHTSIDAAAELRRRGITADQIVSLELGVPTPVIRTIGEPLEIKRRPQTGYQAQFSAPWAVATGLVGGGGLGASLEDFADDLVGDPERLAVAAKVSVVPDATCDRIFPHQFPAILRATLHDGTVEIAEVLANRGGDQRPLTPEEVGTKFTDNASPTLGTDQATGLRQAVLDLDSMTDVGELLALRGLGSA